MARLKDLSHHTQLLNATVTSRQNTLHLLTAMEELQILKNIASNSRRLLETFATPRSLRAIPPHNLCISSSSSTLPLPDSIAEDLVRKGWKPYTAEALSRAYVQHARLLKEKYEADLRRVAQACAATDPNTNILAIHSTYMTRYTRALRRCAELTISQALRHKKLIAEPQVARGMIEKRPSFTQDDLYLLEESYFRNEYPTSMEKSNLAKQTGLDLRQIAVWFQNRRSRSKKNHKSRTKLCFVVPGDHVLPSTDRLTSEPSTRSPSCVQDPTCWFRRSRASDSFDIAAAAHAFPGPYPPICDYDPFPSPASARSFQTVWMRECTSHNTVHERPAQDIEGLIAALSRMTLSSFGHTSKEPQIPTQVQSNSSQRRPACCPFLVLPTTTPLPSLVRACATIRSKLEQISHQTPQNHNVSPVRESYGTAQIFDQLDVLAPRTQALSRRVSRTKAKLSRDHGHPYIQASSLRHASRNGRLTSTSSLASISSDSSSGSPSTIDSPLLTPLQYSVDLPRSDNVSKYAPMLDPVQDLDRIFNIASSSSPMAFDGAYLDALSY